MTTTSTTQPVTAWPAVSVVVPTYRRFEPLLRTLQDLLAQDYPDFDITVVDQNPAWPAEFQGERDRLSRDSRVRWVRLDTPGVVKARNLAIATTKGEIVLFVDDDVFVPHRMLLRAHVANYRDGRIAAVVGRERSPSDGAPPDAVASPRVVLPPPADLTPLQQAIWFNRNGEHLQQVVTFCTCNGSIRRDALSAVYGFDERFTGNSYGDDYDLALRLHAAGFSIVYDPAAWLVHRQAPMGGLRLSDPTNAVDYPALLQGTWLFVLRHGHRGMYRYLLVHHVLRKTVLLKRNLQRPWRQPAIWWSLALGFARARACLRESPAADPSRAIGGTPARQSGQAPS